MSAEWREKKALILHLLLLLSSLATAESWQTPRMPWGDPDLQGVWTNATVTDLERMDGIEELVISEEQARALERQDAQNSAALTSYRPWPG